MQTRCAMTTTLIATVTVTASFVTTVNLTACVVTVAGRMRPTHLLRATALWRRALTRQLSATMAAAACTYTVAEQTVRVHAMRRVCYDNAYTRNSQFSCVCPCFYYCGVSFWHNRAGNPALNTDFRSSTSLPRSETVAGFTPPHPAHLASAARCQPSSP